MIGKVIREGVETRKIAIVLTVAAASKLKKQIESGYLQKKTLKNNIQSCYWFTSGAERKCNGKQ